MNLTPVAIAVTRLAQKKIASPFQMGGHRAAFLAS
jgi:hypothetical protein